MIRFREWSFMGKPISEDKKAAFLQRAEARLAFALNLPAEDLTREAKIKAAERAKQTALASKTAPVGKKTGPGKTGNARKARKRAR